MLWQNIDLIAMIVTQVCIMISPKRKQLKNQKMQQKVLKAKNEKSTYFFVRKLT
jgi:hypothetical protein